MGEEQTELEKMGLEEIALDEFKSRIEFWSSSLPLRETDVCSKVVNPLRFNIGDKRIEGYCRVICYLFEQKVANQIAVSDGKKWVRVKMSISEYKGKLREIAEIASQNPIKNYFEVKLLSKKGGVSVPAIEFVEYMGQLIGYEVGIPFHYRNRFNIVTKREVYGWNNGLWIPENYKDLQSPASLRRTFNQ